MKTERSRVHHVHKGRPPSGRRISTTHPNSLPQNDPDGLDERCLLVNTQWSRKYLDADDPTFRNRIIHYCRQRIETAAKIKSEQTTTDWQEQQRLRLGSLLAIAYGMATPTGLTQETLDGNAEASEHYTESARQSAVATSASAIVATGTDTALIVAGMADPENQCAYSWVRFVVDTTLGITQAALTWLVPFWSAGKQPHGVAGQMMSAGRDATGVLHGSPNISSSKYTGEDGHTARIIPSATVKRDWHFVQRILSIIDQNADVNSEERKAAAEEVRRDLERHEAQARALRADGPPRSNEHALAQLNRQIALLSDLRAALLDADNGSESLLVKHQDRLKEERVIGRLFEKLNVQASSGNVRLLRAVFALFAAGSSLVGSAYALVEQNAALREDGSSSAAGNTSDPYPCDYASHGGFDGVRFTTGMLSFLFWTLQMEVYRRWISRKFVNDQNSKLIAAWAIVAASGTGNLLNADGDVVPDRLDKVMKSSVQLRAGFMTDVWQFNRRVRSLLLVSLFIDPSKSISFFVGGRLTRIFLTCDKLDDTFRQLPTTKDRKQFVEHLIKKFPGCDIVVKQSARARLEQFERIDGTLKLLEAGQYQAFIDSQDVPEATRKMFEGSLLYALGETTAANKAADTQLRNMKGNSQKYDSIESTVQTADRVGRLVAYLDCGSGSAALWKGAGGVASLCVVASGSFDNLQLARIASMIRIGVNLMSLKGSIIQLGFAKATHKWIKIKNLQRQRMAEGHSFPRGRLSWNNGSRSFFTFLGMDAMRGIISELHVLGDFPLTESEQLQQPLQVSDEIPLSWAAWAQTWAPHANLFTPQGWKKWGRFFTTEAAEFVPPTAEELREMERGAVEDIRNLLDDVEQSEWHGADRHFDPRFGKNPGSTSSLDVVTKIELPPEHAPLSDIDAVDSSDDGSDSYAATALQSLRPSATWKKIPRPEGSGFYARAALTNAKRERVGNGYCIVPATELLRVKHGNGLKKLTYVLCSSDPSEPGRIYMEFQRKRSCGLHVLNMLTVALLDDGLDKLLTPGLMHELLLEIAPGKSRQDRWVWAKANGTDFDVQTLLRCSSRRSDVPSLTSVKVQAGKMFDAGANDASDELVEEFQQARHLGITFRHASADAPQTGQGHFVFLTSWKSRIYYVDPRRTRAIALNGSNMRIAALEYFNANKVTHSDADPLLVDTYEVFFASPGGSGETESSA